MSNSDAVVDVGGDPFDQAAFDALIARLAEVEKSTLKTSWFYTNEDEIDFLDTSDNKPSALTVT